MRQALELAVSTLKHVHGSTRDPFVLMALDNIAALTASATKSDGGMEGHADPSSGRSSRASHLSRELEEADVELGPSDLMQKFEQFKAATDERLTGHTRPADVTVDELAQLIIKTIETSAEGCSNGVWVNAHPAARALLDTYKIGAK